MQSVTPTKFLSLVWPLSLSLATTHKISVDFSSSPYLDVSVQAVPLLYLWIQYRMHRLIYADCSIRTSADQCLLTAPRSFSQLTTSFFGSQCQGIHSALLFALPFVLGQTFAFSQLTCSFFTRLKYLLIFLSLLTRSFLFCFCISIQFSSCFSLLFFKNKYQKITFFFLSSDIHP